MQVVLTKKLLAETRPNIIQLLLCREDISITDGEVAVTVGMYGPEVARLLAISGRRIDITNEVVEATTRNAFTGEKVIKVLLHQRNFNVTESTVLLAAHKFAADVVKLLLSKGGINITDSIVIAVAQKFDPYLMELLLKT